MIRLFAQKTEADNWLRPHFKVEKCEWLIQRLVLRSTGKLAEISSDLCKHLEIMKNCLGGGLQDIFVNSQNGPISGIAADAPTLPLHIEEGH